MKAKSAQKTEHTYVQILSRNQENGLKQKKKEEALIEVIFLTLNQEWMYLKHVYLK